MPPGLASVYGTGIAMPLLATQILWINLVTGGAPALQMAVLYLPFFFIVPLDRRD